jgi:hypothetical protein
MAGVKSNFENIQSTKGFKDHDSEEGNDIDELEKYENLEPVILFKAYSDIISNKNVLVNLYQLWKEIPK